MIPDWTPPDHWIRFQTIDMHTEGEPLRVILADIPDLSTGSILDKREALRSHHDTLRTALMWEPRGHADMYGCIMTPPTCESSDFGVLFLHNEGYSTMCGHAIIAITRLAVESGLVPATPPETRVQIDTPAGSLTAHAVHKLATIDHVYFDNVPSYAPVVDGTVTVAGLGSIHFDLAFGGAYYAFVDAGEIGLDLVPESVRDLIDVGRRIKAAVSAAVDIRHPVEEDLGFLYGTILTGPGLVGGQSRHVCVFADGEVDRSPTGTGVSARLALHKRGEIALSEYIEIESIIGSRFQGAIVDTLDYHGHAAVIPRVKGRAFVTGRHEFVIDPNDPLKHGFLLR